jgi:hypothetical protein
MLEQEARAMLRRLDRVKPFSLQDTMVPAAGLMPASLIAIERYLIAGRGRLRGRVTDYIQWLRGPGRAEPPRVIQRRFMVVRLGFNAALSQLDLFADAIGQRSETDVGVWLSGLDVAAQDALQLPDRYYEAPPIICYLHRGLGGAIRRARTRLPGGGESPAAIIRIPRERMIGFGIASSLVHEVGHQAAALLDLVPSLRVAIQKTASSAPPAERAAWTMWERWISEIVADFWALARVGIGSTLGLIGIVSLPRRFVFRMALDDPHPFPWIRVELSCAIGNAVYRHPQWGQLAATWESFYPRAGLNSEEQSTLNALLATMPRFVALLTQHRPRALRGRSLLEVVPSADRAPQRLLAIHGAWQQRPQLMFDAPPTLVFAVLARARIAGHLSPETEDRLLGQLITHWALKSTLDLAEVCAKQSAVSGRRTIIARPQPQLVAAS